MGNTDSVFHGCFKKVKKESTTNKNAINDCDLLYKSYKIIEVSDEETQTDLTACYLNKIEKVVYGLLKKCVGKSRTTLISNTTIKINEDLRDNISTCSSNILNYFGNDLAENCLKLGKSCQTLHNSDKNKSQLYKNYSNTIAVNSKNGSSTDELSHIPSYKIYNQFVNFNSTPTCAHSIQTISENDNTIKSIPYINNKDKIITVQYMNNNHIRPSTHFDSSSEYRHLLQKYLNDNKNISSSSFKDHLKTTKLFTFNKNQMKTTNKNTLAISHSKQNNDVNDEHKKTTFLYTKIDNKIYSNNKNYSKIQFEIENSNKADKKNKASKTSKKNKYKKHKNSSDVDKNVKIIKSVDKKISQIIMDKKSNLKQNYNDNLSHHSDKISSVQLNISEPTKVFKWKKDCYRGILKNKVHNRSISSDGLDEQYWQNCIDTSESTGRFGIRLSNHTIFRNDSFSSSNSTYNIHINDRKRTLSGYILTKNLKDVYQSCFSLDNFKIKCHVLLIRTWSGMWFKSKKPRFDTWSTEEFTAFT